VTRLLVTWKGFQASGSLAWTFPGCAMRIPTDVLLRVRALLRLPRLPGPMDGVRGLDAVLVRRAFRDTRIWSKKWYIAEFVPLVCLARNLLSVSEFQFANRSEF